MAYFWNGQPPMFTDHPIHADAFDWFYLAVGRVTDGSLIVSPGNLEPGEEITGTPSATVTNGVLLEGPVLYPSRREHGSSRAYEQVFGIRVQAGTAGADMVVELTYSTTTGRVNLRKGLVCRVLP